MTIYCDGEIMSQTLEAISVIMIDQDGRIAFINEEYAKVLNVDPEAVIGIPVEEIIPHSRMPHVLRTGKEEIGSVFIMKNGVPIIVNRIPIKKNGEIIGVVAYTTYNKLADINTYQRQILYLNHELSIYKNELTKLRGAKYSLDQVIGTSPEIIKLKDLTRKVAKTKSTVLIVGETGTGKEAIAHSIHQLSPRSHQPFIRLNCAAIPKELLEAEMFGYEEGAFTGAKKGGRPGKFELANGGTLFLDEVHQLPLNLQSKLLRVLQEKEIERVGGEKLIGVDVRLICTTNQNLIEMVNKGEFRDDFYYRINVVEIAIPPLRDRIEDIPQLVDHFIAKSNREMGLDIKGVEEKVYDLFGRYHWPGNIRELEHALERAANSVQSGCFTLADLDFIARRINYNASDEEESPKTMEEIRNRAEKEAIIQALRKTNRNKKLAAEVLQIDRTVLYDKIKKYQIQ